MRYRIDFRKFRTFPCLQYAMKCYCEGRSTGNGRIRGRCPRRDCKPTRKGTLQNAHRYELAFCHCCHRPIDALEIVQQSLRCTIFEAARELERFLVGA